MAATSWILHRSPARGNAPSLVFLVLKARFLKYQYICGDEAAVAFAFMAAEDNGPDDLYVDSFLPPLNAN